jgi:hypothetical protein
MGEAMRGSVWTILPVVLASVYACNDDQGWLPPADTGLDVDAPADGVADTASDGWVPDTPGDPSADDGLPDPDASDPGSDDGGGAAVPMCMQRCGSSADCGNPATPAYSSDNYDCTGGFCIYTGCNSDSECIDSMGAGYGCSDAMGVPYCTQACGTSSECGFPSVPAYTPVHYDCTGGYCVYTGCLSDTECRDTSGVEFGCNSSIEPAYCAETCTSASTCGSPSTPAYSSDNYDCTAGYCVYAGCNSDSECIDSMGAGYGCMGL